MAISPLQTQNPQLTQLLGLKDLIPTQQQSDIAAGPAPSPLSFPGIEPLPSMPAPLSPLVTSPRKQQEQSLQQRIMGYENPAPKPGGFWHKLGQIAAATGNIAGDIALGGQTMAEIPGTWANKSMRHAQDVGELAGLQKQDTEEQDAISRRALQEAQTGEARERTAEMPGEAAQRQELQDAQIQNLLHPQAKDAFALWRQQNPNAPAQDWLSAQAAAKPAKDVSTKEDLQNRIAVALQKGDQGEVKRLQDTLKAIDPVAQERVNISLQGLGLREKGLADQESKANRQDVREHDKAYVQPAESVEKSYQMMDHAYREYQDAKKQGKELPTGAQSMLALSTHLSTTFGNVKGARVTKDMIREHLGARSISDNAEVAIQKLTNGDALSPAQWDAFHDLIKQSRNLSWGTAIKEAARKKVPIDFLPKDLQSRTVNGEAYDLGEDGQYHRRVK